MTNLIKTNNFSKFLKGTKLDKEKYKKLYNESIENNEEFWDKVAKRIDWIKPYSNVKEVNFNDNVSIKWYLKGELNVCSNCLDRHLQTRGDKVAILWEGDDPKKSKKITYKELYKEVCKFSNVLKNQGVKKGDCVTIYLPMIPEAAIAMLACSRIGAVHSVVFGGFSPDSLADRINDCDSAIIITADEGTRGGKIIPLKDNADKAAEKAPCLKQMIVVKRTGNKINWNEARDFWYEKLMNNVSDISPPEKMNSEDPLFILYTSGSTGRPKGVLHTSGGYIVYVSFTHDYIFDIRENDIYWCTADVGWVTGHSYIIYGPLANGATTLMFEGVPNYPDSSRFWQVIDKHKVNIFYTAPTAIRALMKEGEEPLKKTSRKSLRILGTVGEPINPEAWLWYFKNVGNNKCPIMDTWWQTETGGILITPLPGVTDLKPGSATLPFFGIKPAIVNKEGKVLENECEGNLCLLDSWPGQMRTVHKNHERFKETYFSTFEGKYFSGDGCKRDKDGYYWITGRVDDIIIVSGHNLGTAEIESALVGHEKVAEAAVVGYPHDIKGWGIYAYVTLITGSEPTEDLKKELITCVRKEIGPIASPDFIQWAPGLPKTRSGKIMRRILRKIAADESNQLGDVSTLADPSVVDNLISSRLNKK